MTVLDDLAAAAERLRADSFWRDLLAENLYWASNESFLQGSLLGSFNTTSNTHVADRERRLHGFQPDLLIMDRADHDRWWGARDPSPDPKLLATLCRAIVQLKVAWAEGNARGSATANAKAKAVAHDMRMLAEFVATRQACSAYVGVLLVSFHEPGQGAGLLRALRETIRTGLPVRPREERETEIVADHPAPTCIRTGATLLASASLLWVSAT